MSLNSLLLIFSIFKDIKNAEHALFELSRVISLAPDHPEVFEHRAEVTVFFLLKGSGFQYFIWFFSPFARVLLNTYCIFIVGSSCQNNMPQFLKRLHN